MNTAVRRPGNDDVPRTRNPTRKFAALDLGRTRVGASSQGARTDRRNNKRGLQHRFKSHQIECGGGALPLLCCRWCCQFPRGPLGRPVGLRGAGARWEEFFREEFFWEAPVRSHCSPLATRKISRDDVAELCVSLPRGRRRVVRDQVDRAVQPAVDGGGQPGGQGTGLGGRVAQGRLAGRRDRRDQSTDGVVTDGVVFPVVRLSIKRIFPYTTRARARIYHESHSVTRTGYFCGARCSCTEV